MTTQFKPLTKYPVGSVREMSFLAFPLMLSALSGALMFFFDRYILAHFSLEALNTATTAGMSVLVFHLAAMGVAGICEVYVGQSNGAKAFKKIGSHVWQMLWFALMTSVVFIPLSFTQDAFLPQRYSTEQGRAFFQILMLLGPVVAANAALSGFYVGRGKVKLLTCTVIGANVINIGLDLIFIFGYGPVEPMGTMGAALATAIAQCTQFLILFGVFLSKTNRVQFASWNAKFHRLRFIRSIRVGAPSALGHAIEIGAWSMQLHIVAMVSEMHVSVLAIGQTLLGLIAFTTDGLRGAVIACASNLVGGQAKDKIKATFKSAFVVHMLVGCFYVLPAFIHPEWIIEDFVRNNESDINVAELMHFATIACWFIIGYYVVDGLVWIIAGFLTAIEDTWFIMVANALNAWIFGLAPVYYFVLIKGATPDKVWLIVLGYGVVNMTVFYVRYRMKYRQKPLNPSVLKKEKPV